MKARRRTSALAAARSGSRSRTVFDAGASEVDTERPKKGTIAALGVPPAPKTIGMHMSRTGAPERTVFTLRNVHLTFARHAGDDYHFAVEHDGPR